MSFAEKMVEKAGELIEDKGAGWVERLVGEGRGLADRELEGDAKKEANRALDIVLATKQPLARLGRVGLSWVAAHWVDDDAHEARRRYIETEATFEERLAFQAASSDSAADAKDERVAAWEQVADALEKIGKVALEFVLKAATSGVL